MRTAGVLVGVGPMADPWHDFAATGHRVADLLTGWGWQVRLWGSLPGRFMPGSPALTELAQVDLLVLNTGKGDGAEQTSPEGLAALLAVIDQRIEQRRPLLGLHAATNSLHALPGFGAWLGGRWIEGRSMHPPHGQTILDPTATAHPITAGLGPITVADERYSFQQVDPDLDLLVDHQHDGVTHPLVWAARDRPVVYDALGHGVDSYDSPSRVELLRREVDWLVPPQG